MGKGTRVGILIPNGADFVVAFLATTRIGAIAVPLSTLYQSRELLEVLRHADIHTLLTVAAYRSHDYLAKLEQAVPPLLDATGPALFVPALPSLRTVRVWGSCDRGWAVPGPEGLAAAAAATKAVDDPFLRAIEAEVTPADTAVMIYTSGSSGTPKGVVHTHGTVIRHTYAAGLRFHSDLHAGDRLYTTQPFFWIGGLALCVLGCLQRGAVLHCDTGLDEDGILDLVLRERITHVLGMGHTTAALMAHPRMKSDDFGFVRFGLIRTRDAEGQLPPAARIPNRLGMTESFGQHSLESSGSILPAENAGSFGRGLASIERRIMDLDTREPAAPGVLGELWIRGSALMQGIYKCEREDVFERDGFYRTGDLCRIDEEGYLYFEGRFDELVKVRGAGVSLREIEVVLESLPEVHRAGVVAVDCSEGKALVAAVVLTQGASATGETLRTRLRSELSSFKVPRVVVLLEEGELPLTASGKIRKAHLQKLLKARLPGRGEPRGPQTRQAD